MQFTDYGQGGTRRLMGAIDPVNVKWHSWAANGALSKLIGRTRIKFGVDYRFIGLDFQSFDEASGNFLFTRHFTSSDPAQNGTGGTTPSGNAFASFLLGYPSGDPGNLSARRQVDAGQRVHELLRLLRAGRLPREPEADAELWPPPRTRAGAAGEEQQLHRGLRSTLNPGGALGNVVNPLTGQRIVGGLVYAGQNGANEYQGDPPAMKVSPRVGLVYAMNPKTVVRAGLRHLLGAVELPGAEQRQLRPDWRGPADVHQPGPVLSDRDAEQSVPGRPARIRWATRSAR